MTVYAQGQETDQAAHPEARQLVPAMLAQAAGDASQDRDAGSQQQADNKPGNDQWGTPETTPYRHRLTHRPASACAPALKCFA